MSNLQVVYSCVSMQTSVNGAEKFINYLNKSAETLQLMKPSEGEYASDPCAVSPLTSER